MKKILLILSIALIMATGFAMAQSVLSTGQSVNLVDIQEATAKIRAKEAELNEREQALNAREERLNVLEQDLLAREDNIRAMRQEVTDRIAELNTANDAELDRLAQIYASTKAKQAAEVIVRMELDRSAGLMRRMTAMNAGKIMAEVAKLDPDYAAKLTARLSGQQVTIDDISRAVSARQ